MKNQNTDGLKVDILEKNPCAVTVKIEVPHDDVLTETKKVYEIIQKDASVPGFRQGKAPIDIIKKNYISMAREKIVENLIRQNIFAALKSQEIEPVDFPAIDEVSFDFDKPFSFRIKAELHPEFKVKDYKGIKIKKEIIPVTDVKVDENIGLLRERNANLAVSKDEAVAADHFAMVDYECFHNGEVVDGMKAKNQLIDLSLPQNIAGFKDGLLGLRRNEDREIKVQLPAEYPYKKVAGQEVLFKVKLVEIKEKLLPPLDDEFAKDFGLETFSEFKTKIKEGLDVEERKRQKQEIEKQIVESLLSANEFPVPESLIAEQEKFLISRTSEYFKRQGLPESELNKNIEKYRGKYHAEAEHNVRISYILNEIGKKEDIQVKSEDFDKECENLKNSNMERIEEVEKYIEDNKENISAGLKESKIFKFLQDNAKIKEEIKK